MNTPTPLDVISVCSAFDTQYVVNLLTNEPADDTYETAGANIPPPEHSYFPVQVGGTVEQSDDNMVFLTTDPAEFSGATFSTIEMITGATVGIVFDDGVTELGFDLYEKPVPLGPGTLNHQVSFTVDISGIPSDLQINFG